MKKLFFSLLAFAATLGTSAQIVSGTDYLIQNVKTGYYFGGGRDYGTHGTLLAKPQFFTFTTNGSGYSLDSHQYNNATNHFLGTNLYVDGGATAWNVVETSTPGVYTIENGGNYLAGNGFNVDIKTVTDGTDAAAQWKLISKEDALAAAGEGTLENPSNATVLIKNPEIKRNASTSWYQTWTITNYAGDKTPGNFAQGGGAAVANCAESYMSNNGFKATQTITEGVKAGVYRLDAQGFYQQRGTNANVPSIYLNDQSAVLPFNSAKSGSMAEAYSDMLANRWPTEPLYVRVEEGGSLTITVSSDVSSCWTIFGEMSLTYYGNCTVAEAQNAGIVKEWKAYVATKDEVAETLDAPGKSSYNTAKAGIENPTSPEELATAKTTLDAALRAAALAQTTAGADMTLAIANPSFETGDTKGWTIEGNGGAWVMMTRANAADPKVGDYWIEKYGWSGKIDVNQTLTNLHKGHYRVSVLTLDQASKAKLIAESNGITVETPIVGGDKAVYTADIMVDDNQDLKIGVYCTNHNANSWVGIDDFHLTFVSNEFPALPAAVEGKMNADVAAAQTAAIDAYNANKTVANYNAAAAAITAAQNSKVHYDAAGPALAAQKALIDGTNVYAAEGFTAYQNTWSTLNEKYENNTLTNEDGVVNPTIATGWHGSTAYNFLLTPWKLGESACNEFANALYINTWSNEGEGDGSNFLAPFFEYWVADGQNLTANAISTTLDVENGLYEVSALVRASHNADDFKAVNLTVNEGDAVNVADGAQIGSTNRYMNTFTAQGLVKDGKLTIAFDVPAESKISWFCFKNVKYTKVRDLTPEEAMVYATADEIAALNTAITAAEAKTVGFLKDEYAPYTNAEAIKALAIAKAVDTENPVAQETVVNATTALTNATWTANTEEVNAVYDGGFSKTTAQSGDYLVPTGWTNLGYNTRVYNQTNKGSNNGVDAGSEGGCLFAKYTTTYGEVEGYEMPLKAGNYTLKFIYGGWNEVGTRDIKVYSAADNTITATVTPNNVTAKDKNAHTTVASWSSYDGIITIPSDGKYVLSFYRQSTTAQNQIAISDLAIFSISEAELAKRDLLPEIENYVVPSTNIGDAAFQYPTVGIEEVKATIEAAQAVYDNADATLEEVNEAIEKMKNLTNPALNAPADGDKFHVAITYDGYRYSGHALEANATATSGVAVPLADNTANNNYPNDWTFTPVEDVKNGYTMSTTTAEGTFYVCTGAQDNGSSDQQIRMTTDPAKALTIVVSPAKSQEGVYYLNNSRSSNASIGCQDDNATKNGGWYTTGSHNTHTITLATQATATLKITDAQYGTFIAPFDAEIPEGVSAYTISINEDGVTLDQTDATEIKANTAYLVYAESTVNETLSGWGLATKSAYETNALTGVYTKTAATVGTYILQKNNDKVGFYKVASNDLNVGANRCYLTAPTASPVKAFFFDQETAIKAIDALTSGKAEIYDLNGRKLNKMQKGVNIVNGVKILVK